MQCPKCGHTNRIEAVFCTRCGISMSYLRGRQRLQPGQSLKGGAYEVVRQLSLGGMGAIYLVKDLDAFGRLRVLKEMLDYVDAGDYPDWTAYQQAEQKAQERFEDEGRILASLHNPGIPEIITYFTEQDRNYIVMEYVEGKDLNEGLTHIDEQGLVVPGAPYPAADVARWGIQVCKILEYLELRQPLPVIHHDVKPGNLVLDKHTGDIRLVDFGTAQTRLATEANAPVDRRKSSVYGTMGYAPPEQYQGKSVPKSDVYALAATMYHLLTDDDPQQHPMSFPWPESLGQRLVRALSRAVEPDPGRRSSATQFRNALELYLEKPGKKAAAPKTGDFCVVLGYVSDQRIERTIEALQQELSLTELEAATKAFSAPTSVFQTTTYAIAVRIASQLQAAGATAKVVEVDQRYSRSLGPGALSQHLVSRGQVRKLATTKLDRDRRCHCFECGHDWMAPKKRGRRPPADCPQCRSRQWSRRRVFRCRVCGHEFAHGDQESPARKVFPACPACGTLDWLSRQAPVLKIREKELDLGVVRLGQPTSAALTIRNRGKGSLRGVIRGRERWLESERSFSGEGPISIAIDAGSLKGERQYQTIIDVFSNGGAQQVTLQFLTQTPEQVSVSPASLDLGTVDAHPAPQILRVTNSGGGTLEGTVEVEAPWIEVSSTELLGNRVDLSVVARPAEMPAGKRVSASVRLTTNGGDVSVPVWAEALPPSPTLRPQSLDFGAVPPQEKKRLVVRVINTGTGHLRGRITSWPNWVSLRNTRWSGNTCDVDVVVHGRRLPEGVEQTGVIRFSSNGGDADLVVRAVALGATLMVEPAAVYLGAVPAGSKARCRLRLKNAGSGSLHGSARPTVPWLHLRPQQFSGKSVTLRAWLETKGLAPGRYTGTIEIDTNGGRTSVAVQVQITDQSRLAWALRLSR